MNKPKPKIFLGNEIDPDKPFSEEWKKWVQACVRYIDKNWKMFRELSEKTGIDYWDYKKNYPRQKPIFDAIEHDLHQVKEFLNKHPEPEKYAPPGYKPVDERDITMFGIFNDGGNCWSSRSNENWYWSASEGETEKEFRARLRRQGERHAQQNYREYVRCSYGVRVFKDLEMFKRACEKVGIHPDLKEYETSTES